MRMNNRDVKQSGFKNYSVLYLLNKKCIDDIM